MTSKTRRLKTTTCHTKDILIPKYFFGSQFMWELASGDIIVVIPPAGRYIYISTTSLNTITKMICKLGGPEMVPAITSKATSKTRTYTMTVERRFIHAENRILGVQKHKYRRRSSWSDDDWIKYFKAVGRSKGAYNIFIPIAYRRFKSLEPARKLYWELIKRAGFPTPDI